MTRNALLALLAVGLLAGCESDEKKLARLEKEKMMACLTSQARYEVYEEADTKIEYMDKTEELDSVADTTRRAAEIDSLGDRWSEARTKCDLAKRSYERFMR